MMYLWRIVIQNCQHMGGVVDLEWFSLVQDPDPIVLISSFRIRVLPFKPGRLNTYPVPVPNWQIFKCTNGIAARHFKYFQIFEGNIYVIKGYWIILRKIFKKLYRLSCQKVQVRYKYSRVLYVTWPKRKVPDSTGSGFTPLHTGMRIFRVLWPSEHVRKYLIDWFLYLAWY